MLEKTHIIEDLTFEISNKCPNECVFCSSNASPNGNEIITLNTFKKTIDSIISSFGIREISISGGEPFLHKDILDMVQFCKDRALHTTIYTSGLGEKSLPISKQTFTTLKEIGLDKIIFDFQCENQETYSYLMGNSKEAFLNVLKSIICSRIIQIPSEFNFIPLKNNIVQFADIVEYAEIGEIKRINLLKFIPQGRGIKNKEELLLSDEELRQFLDYVDNIYEHTKVKIIQKMGIRKGIPLSDNNGHECNAGISKLVIRYDGIVLPCPAFKEADKNSLLKGGFVLGNIYDDNFSISLLKGKRKKPLCESIKTNLDSPL